MAAEIQNCPLRAEGRCPDDWEAMTPTADARIRQCEVCKHPVFLCRTRDDALFFRRQGWRVALAAEAAPPAVPTDAARPAWAGNLSHCFAEPTCVWGGTPSARWHARETLKAALDAGATMQDILAAVRAFLQDHGGPQGHVQAELDKIRALTF
jgi:hypothetical protein